MSVTEMNPRERAERTERRRRIEKALDNLSATGGALDELSQHMPSQILRLLAKAQERQVGELALAIGNFDDVPF